MTTRILVGYATRYGSTAEVAESVAGTLRDNGLEADIQPLKEVRSLDGYNGVVIGAPLIMFHWHKDALRFLGKFQKALTGVPTAVFALGPMTPGKDQEFIDARAQLDKELQAYPDFKPVEIQIFGGKFDLAKLGFPMSLFMKDIPPSDIRDWDAIRAWAAGLKDKLAA